MNFDIPKKNRPKIHELTDFSLPSSKLPTILKKEWRGAVEEWLCLCAVIVVCVLVGFILYAN